MKKMRMPTGKILVYVDGRCLVDRIDGSFAAYYVGVGTLWRGSTDEVAERHLELRRRRNPIVHRRRVPLPICKGELPTGDLAEAKALLKAIEWTREFLWDHDKVRTVEFCLDSRLIVYVVCGMDKTSSSNLQLVLSDIWRNLWLMRARVLWSLIPGALMKRTVIEH